MWFLGSLLKQLVSFGCWFFKQETESETHYKQMFSFKLMPIEELVSDNLCYPHLVGELFTTYKNFRTLSSVFCVLLILAHLKQFIVLSLYKWWLLPLLFISFNTFLLQLNTFSFVSLLCSMWLTDTYAPYFYCKA